MSPLRRGVLNAGRTGLPAREDLGRESRHPWKIVSYDYATRADEPRHVLLADEPDQQLRGYVPSYYLALPIGSECSHAAAAYKDEELLMPDGDAEIVFNLDDGLREASAREQWSARRYCYLRRWRETHLLRKHGRHLERDGSDSHGEGRECGAVPNTLRRDRQLGEVESWSRSRARLVGHTRRVTYLYG